MKDKMPPSFSLNQEGFLEILLPNFSTLPVYLDLHIVLVSTIDMTLKYETTQWGQNKSEMALVGIFIFQIFFE